MSRLRSPIMYFGGKSYMVKNLLQFIPPHKIYVEVFGGGASLLFVKSPSEIEIYNDIDKNLFVLFSVLRDDEKFEKFYKKVCLTLYSRAEYDYAKETIDDTTDEIERAYKFYVLARQCFGGNIGSSWGFAVMLSRSKMAATVSRWLSMIELLPQIHQRLQIVQVECLDFRKLIFTYDTEETFFYLDPPYLPETRKDGWYKHEMTKEDHIELVDILLKIKGKAMLSGYDNDIYKKLEEHGWIRYEFETVCRAVGRTRLAKLQGEGALRSKVPRIECLWMNYKLGLF